MSDYAKKQMSNDQELSLLEQQIKEAQAARLEALEEMSHMVREVKAMKYNPPQVVRRSIEAVYTVLQCKRWANKSVSCIELDREWSSIQRALSNNDFVSSVLTFEVSMLDHAPHVAEFVIRRYFPQLVELLDSVSLNSSETFLNSSSEPTGRDAEGATPFAAAMKKAYTQESLSSTGLSKQERAPNKAYSLAEMTKARTSQTNFSKAAQRSPELRLPPAAGASADSHSAPNSPGGVAGRRSRSSVKLDSAVKPVLHKNQVRPLSAAKDRSRHSGPQDIAADPLNLAAVRYASQACAVFVSWAIEVLREYLITSRLQLQRDRKEGVDAALVAEGGADRAVSRVQFQGQDGMLPDNAAHGQSEDQDRVFKQSEEWRTQPSGLPVRRPSDFATGSELVSAASMSAQPSSKPLADSSTRIAKACEKHQRRKLFTSAKATLFGRVNCPMMRGPRWGLSGGEGVASPPPSRSSASQRKRCKPMGVSSESVSQAAAESLPPSASADPPSPTVSSSSELSSPTDRLKLLLRQSEQRAASRQNESSSELSNNAFNNAAAGLSKLVSADQPANTASKMQKSTSSPELSTGAPKVPGSGQQAPNAAAGVAKVSTAKELPGLARAKMLMSADSLSAKLAQLPSSLDLAKAEQPLLSPPAAETSAAVESSAPVIVERRTPKWAMDFADMCFIHS